MTSRTMTAAEAEAIEAARYLAECGVPIFIAKPVHSPLTGEWDPSGGVGGYYIPGGWQTFEADPDVLDDWEPGWAVAAVGGHVLDVLDVDPRNGGDVTLARWEAKGLMPNIYARASTPSGGEHLFVASLGIRKTGNNGVDVQAGDSDGGGRGFVFLAPTVKLSRATGEVATYEWTSQPGPSLEALTLIGHDDSGAALRELLDRPTPVRASDDLDGDPTAQQVEKARAVLAKAVREVAEAPEGTRNNTLIAKLPTLYRFALGGCLDDGEVDDRMRTAAEEAGIGDEFADRSKQAWKYATADGPDRPHVDSPEDDFDVVAVELFDATPTLQTIRQAAHSRLLGAPALLCYVLGRVLAEVPPSVVLPPVIARPASLNLGVAVVGSAGAGKSSLLSASAELLGLTWDQSDLERAVGSGEGLVQGFLRWDPSTKENRLVEDPRRIVTVDEVDQLGATQHRSGSTLAPTLRSALTGDQLGSLNATAERSRHVPGGRYRLVMFVGVQPTRADALLRDADAGTPQRLVWVPAIDGTLPDVPPSWPAPLHWEEPRWPSEIDYPEHVKAEVRAARLAQARGGGDPLHGHLLLTRLKVAAALALLHGEVKITDQWWELAEMVMSMSQAEQARCQRVLAGEVERQRRASGRLDAIRQESAVEYRNERAEAVAAAIWREVHRHATREEDSNRKHPRDSGCTSRCISRAMRHLGGARSDLREPALAFAVDSEWVEQVDGERWQPGRSRPAN